MSYPEFYELKSTIDDSASNKLMKQILKCKHCKKLFNSTRIDNVFCSAVCHGYYYRNHGTVKPKKKEECTIFKCPLCGVKRTLSFNVREDSKRWLKFRCSCGYKVMSTWNYI